MCVIVSTASNFNQISNLQEAARLDFINDGVEDVRGAYLKVIYQAWDTKDEFVSKLPSTLANLEKLLSTSAYIVGDKVSR